MQLPVNPFQVPASLEPWHPFASSDIIIVIYFLATIIVIYTFFSTIIVIDYSKSNSCVSFPEILNTLTAIWPILNTRKEMEFCFSQNTFFLILTKE